LLHDIRFSGGCKETIAWAAPWRQGRPGVSGPTGRIGKIFRRWRVEAVEEYRAPVFLRFVFVLLFRQDMKRVLRLPLRRKALGGHVSSVWHENGMASD